MRLSVATLLGFAAAAVNAVVFITNNGNKAAAVFTDAFKNTYVIYQRDDNGVGLLRGSIPNAQSAAAYTASGLLNAGIARSNTPLAIAIDYSPGNSAVCLPPSGWSPRFINTCTKTHGPGALLLSLDHHMQRWLSSQTQIPRPHYSELG